MATCADINIEACSKYEVPRPTGAVAPARNRKRRRWLLTARFRSDRVETQREASVGLKLAVAQITRRCAQPAPLRGPETETGAAGS